MQTRSFDIGDLLPGGYRVLDVLQGGMGVVYVCHQRDTDEIYAIKTVRMDGPEAEVEWRLQLFAREVRTWIHISANSTSPYLVKALTFNADHRMLCLEFIDGLPLHRVVERRRTVHPVFALQWAKDVASGMDELHSGYGVVHRDLKPQNVLIQADTDRLRAKITDFGITRALTDTSGSFTRVGTPAYMAPEVERGAHADSRADIYSYGATLAWMLTGSPTLPSDRAEQLPPALVSLVERCMRQDPGERIGSFAQIRAELDAIEVAPFEPGPHDQYCRLHRYGSAVGVNALAKSRHSACPFCVQHTRLLQLEASITRLPAVVPAAGPARVSAGQACPATNPILRDTAVTVPIEMPEVPAPAGRPRRGWVLAVLLIALAASPLLFSSTWDDLRGWLDSLTNAHAFAGGPPSAPEAAMVQAEALCTFAGCSATALARPGGSRFDGPARYCAEHATHECRLCRQTFHETELDFERKCSCGGAIAPR